MPSDVPTRVDHVGIAVESIEDAEPVLHALGAERSILTEGANGEIRWATYHLGDASRLELIDPLAADSFLQDYLDRHGPGLHHVTLEVAGLEAVADALEREGLRVVDLAHHPDHGYSEAFVSPRNPTGALFQLMEYHEGYVERHAHKRDGEGGPADTAHSFFVGGQRVEEALREDGDDESREATE